MSDSIVLFIPDNPQYELSVQEINFIRNLEWYKNDVTVMVYDTIQFADAGANFESVSCPFCRSDLMSTWEEFMDDAYSVEIKGFIYLDIVTPCCNKPISMHNLDYCFPQGFYKSIIDIPYDSIDDVNEVEICEQLFNLTNSKWRIIHAHY